MPTAAQPWPVAPASDGAEQISQLFWFTLILATIVFILVEGLLIYSSLRFRRRTPLPTVEPPQIHGNTRLEVMWATVPALILIGLFGITVTRLGELSQIPNDPNIMHIGANPGRVNHITYTANTVGEFRGLCAMLCGAGHSGMLFRVTTQSAADFHVWLQTLAAGGTPPAPGAPAAPGTTPAPGAPPSAA